MHSLDELEQKHFLARSKFNQACRSATITKFEFDAIKEAAEAAAREYHDELARSWTTTRPI